MKKTIKDFQLENKTVLIRVDFNVPMEEGHIVDDNRIVASLDTIRYAIQHKAKIVLFSHLGRIKTKSDLSKHSLKPIAKHLSELLEQDIIFVEETRGETLEGAVQALQSGDVLLVQNTRFEDMIGNKESGNDAELGSYWASLGEIFINDAFGTSHRAHASNVGISSHLPSGIGFLVEKELAELEPILTNPTLPFTVLLGGSKVSDKVGVIENIAQTADYILIGGGMAFTFLKASGIGIGNSLFDQEQFSFCHEILEKYPDKIVLPIDVVVAEDIHEENPRSCFINEIKEDEIGLDIGNQTVRLFKQYLDQSKTILWNGPMGMFEEKAFQAGTKEICSVLEQIHGTKIVGGGDTGSAIKQFGNIDSFTHVSTGGGATLEFLEGNSLPGLEAIDDA